MTQAAAAHPDHGAVVRSRDGEVIGRIEAVFVDYVLARTPGLLPIDLYIPASELHPVDHGGFRVELARREAHERWHRPLKQAPHPQG